VAGEAAALTDSGRLEKPRFLLSQQRECKIGS
jgi:hypothetical protein